MLVAAAFVPTPPLLVPAIGGGSAAADEPLRGACRAAVTRLLGASPDEVVVIGTGPVGGTLFGSWDWRGYGVPEPVPAPTDRLPLALAIGSWLLDEVGADVPRRCHAVPADLPAAACAELGRELVAADRRIGLLVCGDGSACRTEKAPGFLDPAAEPWDAAALAALRGPVPEGLLALDVDVAATVQAAGRAPWQVLAGAATGGAFRATVDWADAPYGVMYVVGTWTRKDDAAR